MHRARWFRRPPGYTRKPGGRSGARRRPRGAPLDPESPAAGAERGRGTTESGEGDPILGATLNTLKRAAEGVEIERQVAETLQRSLLPRLPVVPGLRLAARYRPGSVETRIGGDWYDAIPLRGGKVGIAIGDVVGRGVKAAARMAHLQSALRAYALEALRPELVLERMNGFVLEGEQGGMVTLLYAIVDPDGHTVHVASAGHPPPMVLDPEGRPTFVEAPPGSPLGVARYAAYEESVTSLDPWSALLLYTDGLVEGPELPLGQGLDGLLSSMEGGPREPEALCQAVLDSLDVRVGFSDDLALLAAAAHPAGQDAGLGVPSPALLARLDAAGGGAVAASRGCRGGRDLRDPGGLRRGLRERGRARPPRALGLVVRGPCRGRGRGRRDRDSRHPPLADPRRPTPEAAVSR